MVCAEMRVGMGPERIMSVVSRFRITPVSASSARQPSRSALLHHRPSSRRSFPVPPRASRAACLYPGLVDIHDLFAVVSSETAMLLLEPWKIFASFSSLCEGHLLPFFCRRCREPEAITQVFPETVQRRKATSHKKSTSPFPLALPGKVSCPLAKVVWSLSDGIGLGIGGLPQAKVIGR